MDRSHFWTDQNLLIGRFRFGRLHQRFHEPLGSADVGFFGEAVEGLFEECDRESGEIERSFDRLVFSVFLQTEGEDLLTFDVDDPIFRDTEGGVELLHFIEVNGEGCIGDFSDEIGNTPCVEIDTPRLAFFPSWGTITKVEN